MRFVGQGPHDVDLQRFQEAREQSDQGETCCYPCADPDAKKEGGNHALEGERHANRQKRRQERQKAWNGAGGAFVDDLTALYQLH